MTPPHHPAHPHPPPPINPPTPPPSQAVHFIDLLVGPGRAQLSVQSPQQYGFDPDEVRRGGGGRAARGAPPRLPPVP